MNDYYIYAHINPIKNEIFYIGKGRGKRAYTKRKNNKEWNYIVNKYNYEIEFLEKNLTESKAFELEKYWINKIGRKDLKLGTLVNYSDGGEGASGYKMTKEQKLKISKAVKSRGQLSNETKDKIRLKLQGKKLDANRKLNISKALSNKKCNVSTNILKRKSTNTSHHLYNKSSAKARKIIQYTLDGDIVAEFNSISEASIVTNISHISRAIAKNKQCNGFIFKYKE